MFKTVKNEKKGINIAGFWLSLILCSSVHAGSCYINHESPCFRALSAVFQRDSENLNMFTLSSLHVQIHRKLFIAFCLFGIVRLSLDALQYKTKLSQLWAALNVTVHGWKPVLVLASAKPKSCNNKNRQCLKSTGFIWFWLHTSNTGKVSQQRLKSKKVWSKNLSKN